MPYTVNAYNPLSPLATDGPPSNVAAELRAIKARLDLMQASIGAASTIGSILILSVNTTPDNYLAIPLVPTNVSRITYAALFAAIGTSWGVGDGTTTFGLPYIRDGYALLAGAGLGDTTGSLIAHTHPYQDSYFIENDFTGPAISGKMAIAASTYLGSHSSDIDNNALYYRNGTTSSTGTDTTNRAAGTYLKYFIRYQ